MKKFLLLALLFVTTNIFGQEIVDSLSQVTIVSSYRNGVTVGSSMEKKDIEIQSFGQEPTQIFSKMPSIFSYTDNGSIGFGYGYMRVRGLGQERIASTMDGIDITDQEDFGAYYANFPDLMGSSHSVKFDKGAGLGNSGTAIYAGHVSFESPNLVQDTTSVVDFGYGSFNSYKASAHINSGVKNGWGYHIGIGTYGSQGFKLNSQNESYKVSLKVGKLWNRNSLDFYTLTGLHMNGQSFLGIPEIPSRVSPLERIPNGNMEEESDNFITSINRLQYKGWIGDKFLLIGTGYYNFQKGDYRMFVPELYNYDLFFNSFGVNVLGNYYTDNNNVYTLAVNIGDYMRKHSGEIIEPVYHKYYSPSKTADFAYVNKGNKPSVSIYAKAKWNVNNFTAELSGQYRYVGLFYTPIKANDDKDISQSYNWNILNGSLDLSYRFNQVNKGYFRFSTTGKEPSRTDIFGGEYYAGSPCIKNPENLERVYDFELGYELKADKVRMNVNCYAMIFNGELVATGEISEQNGMPLHQPVDGIRSGLELSLDWNIYGGLHLMENGSVAPFQKMTSLTGIQPLSPKFLSYTEIYWDGNGFRTGLGFQYRSKMFLDLGNTIELPNLMNLNAYMEVDLAKNISLDIRFQNITNHVNCSNGVDCGDGTVLYQIEAPFTFWSGIKIKF